jgi:hypothetical protein
VAQDDVLGDSEDWDEHEVLMDHSNARGKRIARLINSDWFSIDENFTRVRSKKSVEDIHEGGLTCAILTQNCVNLAITYLEVNMVICNE